MYSGFKSLIAAIVACVILPLAGVNGQNSGAFVTISGTDGGQITNLGGTCDAASAAVIGAEPALENALTCDFTLDATSDILLIEGVATSETGTIFNFTEGGLGSDHSPPVAALVNVFPALAADSWITTPGASSTAPTSRDGAYLAV